jgi:hypothetical protein
LFVRTYLFLGCCCLLMPAVRRAPAEEKPRPDDEAARLLAPLEVMTGREVIAQYKQRVVETMRAEASALKQNQSTPDPDLAGNRLRNMARDTLEDLVGEDYLKGINVEVGTADTATPQRESLPGGARVVLPRPWLTGPEQFGRVGLEIYCGFAVAKLTAAGADPREATTRRAAELLRERIQGIYDAVVLPPDLPSSAAGSGGLNVSRVPPQARPAPDSPRVSEGRPPITPSAVPDLPPSTEPGRTFWRLLRTHGLSGTIALLVAVFAGLSLPGLIAGRVLQSVPRGKLGAGIVALSSAATGAVLGALVMAVSGWELGPRYEPTYFEVIAGLIGCPVLGLFAYSHGRPPMKDGKEQR